MIRRSLATVKLVGGFVLGSSLRHLRIRQTSEQRPNPDEPQRFLYQTRIDFGLAVAATGESMGQRNSPEGDRTSPLRFASEDWKSLITSGSDYWRYLHSPRSVRLLTWYDYDVRFGSLGRQVDRLLC